ncbi:MULTISPECIES: DUF3574 domain-containing protein [unclassified Lysobacter]|uniref:DUF3574 domain-containing protein n=1 Tax=unclassified Lysobacter TaxID=2635362 RepID=UPI001BE9B591|nr:MULTISPECIES: DUF3574 domain-containing protein [unclassified Lysobacter]MBT2747347.1 DUF3574 domain-containing protein [Lysobacter sp. ISL-42]MBT2753044.1 DUF3574 domain-containing protein [Lysobacter sp. ISL-50]MBT2776142.1 DUF3574 domain-containing protein [Lysobacter sp. ISL-54]MBT2784472.1 DUF3574 domain-containing protein [Lysobacter sp. ISL-52]
MSCKSLLSAALLCALTACASLAPLPVKPGDPSACTDRRADRVVFGMNSPDGPVSEAQWQAFLAEFVTPRFPAGLTVYRAKGQWRGDSGQVEQEDSRAIDLIHEDSAEERKRVVEIADEYKRRFKQEAVLIVSTPARACFAQQSANTKTAG